MFPHLPTDPRPHTATCSRPEDCGIASATVGQWIRASCTDTSLPARPHNDSTRKTWDSELIYLMYDS